MIHKILGKVIHGEKLGRKLGFPTANIHYEKNDIENSVYNINIVFGGKIYRGMGSYMVSKKVFEAHIFEFNQDIYGKEIEVILLKKIRNNKKFSGLEELIDQIQQDKITCASQEIKVLTFGSFDMVHQGHRYYLSQAQKYGNHLSTVVASDENITSIKGEAPHFPLEKRIQAVQSMGIADKIIHGSKDNPMQWIRSISPDYICLGYDQRGPFVDALAGKIGELGLMTQIIRIPAHKPDIFKSSLLKQKNRS